MAVDSLVDKTKLNNSLSYEADRIRLKTGGSADIAFDFANEKGFGDAIDAIPSGGGDSIYLTQYALAGDTTIQTFLDGINYTVHYTDVLIMIRCNGTVAPTSGSYTMNNYFFLFSNSERQSGAHQWTSGKTSPNLATNLVLAREADNVVDIRNGVLTYTGPSSYSSCMGTTGDSVSLVEIPFDFARYTEVVS